MSTRRLPAPRPHPPDPSLDDDEGDDIPAAPGSVRLDRWLVASRMFKTRPLAQEACSAGHVKVNGHSAESAKGLKVGDEVDALAPGGRRVWRVLGLAVKRGPAAVARTLYEDHTPPPPPPTGPVALRERGAGRPTKRQGRDIRRLKGW